MKTPLLICGCPGSGTSLVAKILRHSGLFLGADAGPIDARKYHESQCFKRYNIQFLSRSIDFPHAPKSAEQFRNHNRWMQDKCGELYETVDLERLLAEFWGEDGDPSSLQPWGWKDPRNSATAMIWKHWFPQLRVIVISRTFRWRDRWKSGGSESGTWYRKRSTPELRKLYEQPVGIDRDSMLYVDVDQLTSDADCLEHVLTWCGLTPVPKIGFDELMEKIGLER